MQDYVSKIQGYMNDFNLWADTSSSTGGGGTMPKGEDTNYLMEVVPTYDDWRFFTQMVNNNINTLADNPEEIVTKMKAQEAQLQKEQDLEVAAIFSKLWPKSEKRNS